MCEQLEVSRGLLGDVTSKDGFTRPLQRSTVPFPASRKSTCIESHTPLPRLFGDQFLNKTPADAETDDKLSVGDLGTGHSIHK